MTCGDPNCNLERESKMVVLASHRGKPTVWCDPCIAPLVKALNDAGIRTVASCCGHGRRPGTIMLADGRELIIAADFAEARRIDALFPTDINGAVTRSTANPAAGASAVTFPYVYRWNRPEGAPRKGQPCAVTARGTMNSCRVEFPDGFVMITSRNALRRAKPLSPSKD